MVEKVRINIVNKYDLINILMRNVKNLLILYYNNK